MASEPRIAHLVSLQDLSERKVEEILDLSLAIKRAPPGPKLAGKSVGLLFFRGSLRTRASVEAAMNQLGGHTINLTASSDFWGSNPRKGA
jgi:ornithine carbamoyltransferase